MQIGLHLINESPIYNLVAFTPAHLKTKICKFCQLAVRLSSFSKDVRNKDGLGSYCKKCVNFKSKEWTTKNKARRRILSKKWADKHKGYNAQWQKEHPEACYDKSRKWQQANKEKCRVYWSTHRSKTTKTHYTANDVQLLLQTQNSKCVYCDTNISNKFHVDHVHPLSRGGSNEVTNIALACPTCNHQKGSKILNLEWIPPNKRS